MLHVLHKQVRIAGVIIAVLLGGLIHSQAGQTYCRSEFRKYFEGLGAADARVNPVERFVFSLLLTKTRPEAKAADLAGTPPKPL